MQPRDRTGRLMRWATACALASLLAGCGWSPRDEFYYKRQFYGKPTSDSLVADYRASRDSTHFADGSR